MLPAVLLPRAVLQQDLQQQHLQVLLAQTDLQSPYSQLPAFTLTQAFRLRRYFLASFLRLAVSTCAHHFRLKLNVLSANANFLPTASYVGVAVRLASSWETQTNTGPLRKDFETVPPESSLLWFLSSTPGSSQACWKQFEIFRTHCGPSGTSEPSSESCFEEVDLRLRRDLERRRDLSGEVGLQDKSTLGPLCRCNVHGMIAPGALINLSRETCMHLHETTCM